MPKAMKHRKDAFLCYASEDKPMVRSIALGLERYDITTWFDEAEMRPGDNLIEKISTAIDMAKWFCVFLTSNSVKKSWVRFELGQAMEREIRKNKTFVIPVLLYDCEPPPFLRNKHYIDLRDWDRYGHSLEKLAIAIKGDITEIPKDFVLGNLDDPNVDVNYLLTLPPAQAAIELKLRYDNFTSRKLSTLRDHSGLTMKQVIHYCETSPHIILNPEFNARGEIFYALKWKVLRNKSKARYKRNLDMYLQMLTSTPTVAYPKDVISYLLSFYSL
jgi:hypothetical protein